MWALEEIMTDTAFYRRGTIYRAIEVKFSNKVFVAT